MHSIKKKWGLSSYLSHDIFQEVEFYEASNGNYIGEHGIVTIKLNEEEDGFEYDKSSKSIYNEGIAQLIKCEITEEQARFLGEYVMSMDGSDGEEYVINYIKDFILTEKMEEMVDELHYAFYERVEDWASNFFADELEDESESYSIRDITTTEENRKFYVNIIAQCGVYVEKEN